MAQIELMKVHIKHIPEDIRLQYKLHNKLIFQDYVYIRINKWINGLKKAAILSYDNQKQSLALHGYTHPSLARLAYGVTRLTRRNFACVLMILGSSILANLMRNIC